MTDTPTPTSNAARQREHRRRKTEEIEQLRAEVATMRQRLSQMARSALRNERNSEAPTGTALRNGGGWRVESQPAGAMHWVPEAGGRTWNSKAEAEAFVLGCQACGARRNYRVTAL